MNNMMRNLTAACIVKYMRERFSLKDKVTVVEIIRDDKKTIEKKRKGTIIFMNDYYTAVRVKKNNLSFILSVLNSDVYYHNAMKKA